MSALQKLAVANDLGTSAGLLTAGEKPRSARAGASVVKTGREGLDSRGSIISQLSRLSFMVGTEYGGNFSKLRPPHGREVPALARAGLPPPPGTGRPGTSTSTPAAGAARRMGSGKKSQARAVTPLITRPHVQKDLRILRAEDGRGAGGEPADSRAGPPPAGPRVPSTAGRHTPGVNLPPGSRKGAPPGSAAASRRVSRPVSQRLAPPGTGSSVNILDPERREWAQAEPMVLNLEDAVESTLEVLEYELERPPSEDGSSAGSLCDEELQRLHAEREALAREGEFEPREDDGVPAPEELEALRQAIEGL